MVTTGLVIGITVLVVLAVPSVRKLEAVDADIA